MQTEYEYDVRNEVEKGTIAYTVDLDDAHVMAIDPKEEHSKGTGVDHA